MDFAGRIPILPFRCYLVGSATNAGHIALNAEIAVHILAMITGINPLKKKTMASCLFKNHIGDKMKLQFKHQKFQADAAKAVVDVFAGQPYLTSRYMIDSGATKVGQQYGISNEDDFIGWRNERIVPELSDAVILEQINKIQRANQIEPSARLERSESCRFNLTIEMETGVGKTYTYIKTMYELNKHYGWSKFIVVVPSIAIREGVYKSFQVTLYVYLLNMGRKSASSSIIPPSSPRSTASPPTAPSM